MAFQCENVVVDALKAWFEANDYDVKENVTGNPTRDDFDLSDAETSGSGQGVDLVAERAGIRWIIEAKGDAKESIDYYDRYTQLIGQIACRMKRRASNLRYAVAVPWSRVENGETPSAAAVLSRYADSVAWEDLDLWFLAVRDNGTVIKKAPKEVGPFLSATLFCD